MRKALSILALAVAAACASPPESPMRQGMREAIEIINEAEGAAREMAARQAEEARAAYSGPLVKRTALVVSDMDRALTIYRDLLGFQVNSLTQSSSQSYSYPVFALPTDRPIRFATLNSGPDQQRSLALVESPGIDAIQQSAPRPVALVINANGRFATILARAREMGLTVVDPRPLVTDMQGEGVEGAFLDHDGHLIVIYEFPNADRPNRM